MLNQADLEAAVGVARLPELLLRSSSESGAVFTARVAEICQAATDRAAGILYQAFEASQIRTLFATDYSIWRDVRDIGAGLCGLYQTELVDPDTGNFPFCAQYREAIKDLQARVKGSPRVIGEETAGANKALRNRVQRRPSTTTFGEGHGGF